MSFSTAATNGAWRSKNPGARGASTPMADSFGLASEALRIRLAHLFDPYLAVHTSNLDPLPHQIRAVIITRDSIEASRSGNPFAERNLVIARMHQLSRREDLQAKLEQTDWDLIVVDEAHKMSAHFYGVEVNKTGLYRLGELLGRVTRHFLLMTATPHSGKPEDFQLFMALIDQDQFEGKRRPAIPLGCGFAALRGLAGSLPSSAGSRLCKPEVTGSIPVRSIA
jgi:hypothetical protein